MARVILFALLLTIALCSSASANTVCPTVDTPAHRMPDAAAPVAQTAKAHKPLAVIERTAGWSLVRVADRTGWVADAALGACPTPKLAPAVARRFSSITHALGSRASVVVLDADGQRAFAHRPTQARQLASVTKVFTVAAALDRFSVPQAGAILRPSDNARAQALSNRLGGGSATRGAQRARRYAAKLGVRVSLGDGSGLSRRNRASAQAVATFFHRLRQTPRFAKLYRALPVAGRSGTLARRLTSTRAAGRCHAKTGTLNDGTTTLVGYCTTRSGQTRTFALLMRGQTHAMRSAQDRLLAALVADR